MKYICDIANKLSPPVIALSKKIPLEFGTFSGVVEKEKPSE
jgi:hypothetical protein